MFILSKLFPELHTAATMSHSSHCNQACRKKKIIQRLCALSNIITGLCARREGLVVSVRSYMDRACDIWEGRRCSNANTLFKEGAIKHSWHLFLQFYMLWGMYSAPMEGAISPL